MFCVFYKFVINNIKLIAIMKKLTLSLALLTGLTFNAIANTTVNTTTASYSYEFSDDNEEDEEENLKKMSDRKIGKFLGSKKYEKDGALESYLSGFFDVEAIKVSRVKFYKDKESNEVVLINKKSDEVVRTGDFL